MEVERAGGSEAVVVASGRGGCDGSDGTYFEQRVRSGDDGLVQAAASSHWEWVQTVVEAW